MPPISPFHIHFVLVGWLVGCLVVVVVVTHQIDTLLPVTVVDDDDGCFCCCYCCGGEGEGTRMVLVKSKCVYGV